MACKKVDGDFGEVVSDSLDSNKSLDNVSSVSAGRTTLLALRTGARSTLLDLLSVCHRSSMDTHGALELRFTRNREEYGRLVRQPADIARVHEGRALFWCPFALSCVTERDVERRKGQDMVQYSIFTAKESALIETVGEKIVGGRCFQVQVPTLRILVGFDRFFSFRCSSSGFLRLVSFHVFFIK